MYIKRITLENDIEISFILRVEKIHRNNIENIWFE